LTNQDDIVVGIPVANRTLEGSEKMVGYCTHLLPIRSFLVGFPAFSEYLTKIKHVLLDAYEHQDYPFAKLLNQLNLGRDPSRSPLVSATFNLDRSLAVPKMFGLELNLVEPPISYAQFDISLNVTEINDELLLEVDYSTDLFEAETITRMLGHLQSLLEGMVANPAQRLVDLPLLTQPERHTLLVEWNDTQVDYPKDVCIHELFEAQVERTPDAVAVRCESEQLTYWELNNRANQLAHHLRALGVGPDVLVGICVERSLEMVVGLLGILKAGGAYVPLDPAYPQERLAFMLEDSQVPVLLTQQQLVEKLPKNQARVVCLDSDWEAISPPGMASLTAQHNQENLVSSVTPENLVYVIYTSGSTGTPKGVPIQHTGLVNLVIWHQRVYSVTSADRATQLAGPAFDASVWELWPYLTAGASIHIPEEPIRLSAAKLLAWLVAEAITICFMPTPLAEAVLAEDWRTDSALRVLLTGGDRLHRVPGKAINFSLVNHYGPTENTVVTTCTPVAATGTDAPPPIGRPISNTQVYILDTQMQPVPIGIPGELYIGGVGLAQGYLNRPELTTEKFIPNPFSNVPGARLYKTGDLARYLTDGNIEYLGRLDDQVKIRGFRIELGEIEAVLGQHPAVRKTVVIVREDIPGNKRLVAYVVVNQLTAPTIPQLQQFLKQKLPEYMVPSAIVLLDALPLTPNGKIDRRALPAPDAVRSEGEAAYAAPRTPVEEMLAGIWADVLGVNQVGIHDNFFELGGHSLLATQLVSRLRDTFCVELPLRGLFESPTVVELAERIEAVHRSELDLQAPPLLPVSREGKLPLSFAQTRLWFLEQLQPGSAYNIAAAVRLMGSLHVAALEQSLNEIVQRHETLRTTFTTLSGEPVQVIAPVLALSLPLVDLRQLPEAQQELEVERLASEEAQRPFDPSIGPLLRATLLQLGEAEHVLLLTMHHIVSDGWSMGVLIRELAALYQAFSTGNPSPLPELPIQYADFAHWQHQWLQGEVLETQLVYWQQQLAGAPAVLELPTDRPRPAVQTFRGASQSLALSKSLSQKLKTLSQRCGVTLFMTLLAAFQTLLYRYTGQDDICVGSPIANRNRSETEGLIGFFVNTLVLRTHLAGNLSFQELLERVREVALGAYAHQDLPFEQLVEALQPERSLSHQPLFQVMFALQNAPTEALELPGLTLSSLEIDTATAKFDLTLSMEDTPQGLMGSLEYSTDLFDATTISRMLEHLQTLLEGIVANPQQRLADLPLLTEAERQQLLVEWNRTAMDYPKDVCVHQLFEAQVEQTPEAVAVVFADQQLTYSELNRHANQVAHHLVSLGVGPDVLVGICVERSVEMVVGLLGILKAGGAYVPLDPAYPGERLAFMLEDSEVPILLTQQRLIEGLPKHEAKVVCLDADWILTAADDTENPTSNVTPDQLAYVIYTSGSTGQPKGVQIEHRGLLNLVFWHQRAFAVSPADRATQLAGPAFDASVWELWPYLTAGARIYIANEETRVSPVQLRDWLIASAITISFLPTPLAESVLSLEWSSNTALRTLLTGGDKLHNYPPLSIPFELVNNYGPTENSVVTTSCLVLPKERTDITPPIGRPIANTQVYLLDAQMQPVPIGVPGELYIGGAGLARGYLNRPELNAEKFIPNPFSNKPGARLYKTGDLARYLPDSNIEFLGRIDQQVKIRGFRIELGEIESVLQQHPGVQEAVVIAREDVPGNKRLVAYVVVNQTAAPAISQLHQFLKQKLPEYMIPSAIVQLEALPLTPNGKVDRRALRATDTPSPARQDAFVAPRDTLELQLAHVWEDVLNVRPIGVTDNFFNLGGHSLLAVRLIALLGQQFGQNLPLATLFQAPTIEQLASTLRQPTGERQWSSLVKIQPDGSKRPFFCVPGAGGNVIYFYHLARHLGSDQPFYGLQARGLDGEQLPHIRVEDIAADYIEALQTVQPQGPYLLGGHSFGGHVAFEMALQLQKQGQEVALLAILDTQAPIAENKSLEEDDKDDAKYLTELASVLESFFGKSLSVSYEDLQPLKPDEQLNYLLERLKMVNIFPPEAKLSQLRGFLQVFKANHQAHYVSQDIYPNRITVFRGSEECRDDPAMSWDRVSSQPIESLEVPGDHITMMTEPHVQVLAEKLRACLDKAISR
jgi:amino acid adenylation domain-containing protein